MESLARTFINRSRQNQIIHDNIIDNAPMKRKTVAVNTNSAVTGFFHENLFYYQQFLLRELIMIRNCIDAQIR